MVIRLHDSMLSNLVDPIFAGKTFTNEELVAQAAELTGETPAEVADDDESFSITFDSVRPIQFEFDENILTVSISGKRFGQDDLKINAGLQIKVRFKIKRTAMGLQLVRDGDAVIEYNEPDKKDAKIVAFKSFLEDRLNAEAQTSAAIDLPPNLLPVDQVDALKSNPIARNLQLVQCTIDNGWLYLGWRHTPGSMGSMGSMGCVTDLPGIWNEAVFNQFPPDFIDQAPSVLSPEVFAPALPTVEGQFQTQ